MKIKFIAFLFVTFVLSACAQTNNAVTALEPIVLEDRSHPLITIIYGSEVEYNAVKVMDRQLDATGNLPRVIVRLKNVIPNKVPFEYQCSWEDEFGAPLITSSAWQRITLPQNGEKVVVDMGKSIKAKKVTVHFRFAQDVQIWVPTPDPSTMNTNQTM